MRVPFGRFLSMFAAGDPRAEEFFWNSVIGVAILAAIIGVCIAAVVVTLIAYGALAGLSFLI